MSIQVSVIIASYNIEGYAQAAIDSALAQKNVSIEVIVVDDCSSDKSWDILQSQTDPRIHVFQLGQNSGPSAARNMAIEQSTGEWIAVLDGDDRMVEDRLARMLNAANQQKADIVIDNLTIYNETTKSESPMFSSDYLNDNTPLTLGKYIAGNIFKQSAQHTLGYTKPLIRRKYINQHNIRYNPDIRIGEDYDLMARLLAQGATCTIDNHAGYIYTARNNSISHRLTPEDMQRVKDIDNAFKAQYAPTFDASAKKAQAKRDKSIRDVHAFTLLVDGIKGKNIALIFKSIILSPLACRHLKAAIKNRL